MDYLFQYNDIFFFKIQQKLFYFLTVADDNSDKNVFINKDFYDEIIKNHYLDIKTPYPNNNDYDNKNGNSNYNSYGNVIKNGINNKPEKNSLYSYDKKNNFDESNYYFMDGASRYNDVKDNNFSGKKLNGYNDYDSSFRHEQDLRLNNPNHDNNLPYPKMANDYYDLREENNKSQKPYTYNKNYPESFNNRGYPNSFQMNRQNYDDCYNNNNINDNCNNNNNTKNNYNNHQYNSNDTNNDKSIMIPKISKYNNSGNLPSSSSLLTPYNETPARNYPSDNYFQNNNSNNNSNNSFNNSRKNSINFINGSNINNVNQNSDFNYQRNQESPYSKDSNNNFTDNYKIKRESLDIKDMVYPDDHINSKNQCKLSDNNNYYRDKDQKIQLPRIHECIDNFNNNNKMNPNDDSSFNDPYKNDNRNYRERFDPVRGYASNDFKENQNTNRYPPIANNDYKNNYDDRRYRSSPNGYNEPNKNCNYDYNDDEYNKTSCQYLGGNDVKDQDNRNSINNLLNNNANQVVPNSLRNNNHSYRSYSEDSNEKDYHASSNIRNLLRNDDEFNEARTYPPDDRIRKRSLDYITNDERNRKRQMSSMPFMNDSRDMGYSMDNRGYMNDAKSREYPLDNRDSMNDMRGRPPIENMPYMDGMGNRPPLSEDIRDLRGRLPPPDIRPMDEMRGRPLPPDMRPMDGMRGRPPPPDMRPMDRMRGCPPPPDMRPMDGMRGRPPPSDMKPVDDIRVRPPLLGNMDPLSVMRNRSMDDNDFGHYMGYRNIEENQGRENVNNDPRFYSGSNSYERNSYIDNRRRSQDKYDDFNIKNQYNGNNSNSNSNNNSNSNSNNKNNNNINNNNSTINNSNFNNNNNTYPNNRDPDFGHYYGAERMNDNDINNNNNGMIKNELFDGKNPSSILSVKTSFNKKQETQVLPITPHFPVNALDMLDDDTTNRNTFYPTIKYKFKNYKVTDIEKEKLFDINFDSFIYKNSFEDRKNFQSIMKFITPIIIDRFYDINDVIINKYLLNQYINFEILEFFFHNLNKYFSNNISSKDPIFLMVLLENEKYFNFLPDNLCYLCIQSVIKFSKQRIKLSKTDIYRYYLYENQVKLIIKQCGIIRDLMINILNAAYIKHDVEQIKKIYNYPDIINTFKLLKACISNDTSEIDTIIKQTSSALFYKTVQGYTPLHLAINNDNLEIIRILLRYDKINVNIYDKYGFSPIFYAILKKRYDILKMLINHPSVKINYKNITGLSPLLFSVVLNNKEALKILLSHSDIDINITGKHNNTALINLLSNTRNFIEDYQRMIYHLFSLEGTNINYNDMGNMKMLKGGKSDEYVTRRYILNKIDSISEVSLQQNELMNIIIDNPRIDLSKKNNYYNNALFYAAKNFNIEIVNKILKKSDTFDVNEKLFNGKTVLHKTIKKKSDKVIKGVRKSSCTEVMNINNIILKKENNDTSSAFYDNNNDHRFKHPDNNNVNNKLRPILPSPSSSSNTPNSSMNSSNINYYTNNNGNSNPNNNDKAMNNYNYPYTNNNNSPKRYMFEQERNRNYYSSSFEEESISVGELYNMMTSDLHHNYIAHHENVESCQFCKAYLYFLNNINDEYERLIQLSAEDIIRYEIIKLFLDNPSVNINIQDDKGITPIMKVILCQRFDILVLILRMRLLKVNLTLTNYQNETSFDMAKRLGYNEFFQLQIIHRMYLQHVYQ